MSIINLVATRQHLALNKTGAAHNWANFDATRRSYDLIARHVFPRWQGQTATEGAMARARAARPELAAVHAAAVEAATERFQKETAARAH